MTLSTFQKGRIDAYLEKNSEAKFKALCEKHKVDMDNLDDADPHGVYNMITDVRAELEGTPAYVPSGEKQAATTTAKVIQEPKPTAQAKVVSSFTPRGQAPQSQKPIKKLEDYLIDLRACYPDTVMEFETVIIDKTPEFCLTKCSIEIQLINKAEGTSTHHYEAFGYAVKEEEGTGQQKKYMIPLSEARAVKRACRLATVGMKE